MFYAGGCVVDMGAIFQSMKEDKCVCDTSAFKICNEKQLLQCLMGRVCGAITFLNVLRLSDCVTVTVEYVWTDLSSLSPSLCKTVSVTSCQKRCHQFVHI